MPITKVMPQYKLAESQFRKKLLKAIPPEANLKEVAHACHIPYNTLYRYVQGRSLPSVPALMCICHGLGVTPNYMLGFKEEEKGKQE